MPGRLAEKKKHRLIRVVFVNFIESSPHEQRHLSPHHIRALPSLSSSRSPQLDPKIHGRTLRLICSPTSERHTSHTTSSLFRPLPRPTLGNDCRHRHGGRCRADFGPGFRRRPGSLVERAIILTATLQQSPPITIELGLCKRRDFLGSNNYGECTVYTGGVGITQSMSKIHYLQWPACSYQLHHRLHLIHRKLYAVDRLYHT